MIEIVQRNIVRFFVLILFQGLVLNTINLGGYLNPYVYILFILLIPFETPKWFLLISGFLIGLAIDMFESSLGIHASAMVLMAFARPSVLQYFAPRDGYEARTFPRIYYYGFTWFLKYSAIMVSIHHIMYFFMEAFGSQPFFPTLLKAILNTLFTLLFVVGSQYVVYRK